MKLTKNILCLPTAKVDVAEMLGLQYGKSEADIQKTIDTTGVRAFHNSKNKTLSTFVLNAAIQIRGKTPDVFVNADAVIVVSQTYDLRIPSISTQLQGALELDPSTFCLDINDGCSGFIKAARIAAMLLGEGRRKVIIVAGDLNSMMTEKAESATRVLFGDGISVSVFENSDYPANFEIFNDGKNANRIRCEASTGIMEMNGFEVFRFTRNVVPKFVSDYFMKRKVSADNFQLFGFHQASKLVVTSLTSLLKISNQVIDDFNCCDVGNLGAGSIGAWLALTHNLCDAQSRRMLAIGYGAGLSWGLADLFVELNYNEVIYVDD